uniref:Mff-like domain-containing protein n=1 Tax=Nothoprocta perdicaria TaxID=30464 RepID=A0A8C6Z1W9_NOTPE
PLATHGAPRPLLVQTDRIYSVQNIFQTIGSAAFLCLQLLRISGRLRVLEEQCSSWRQKETLVYSVLISACLINTWLWLRR